MSEQQRVRFSASRIHGQADIDILHAGDAARATAYVRMPQVRAFHVLAVGRPAEELPRIMARISGLCPWHHHVAATIAVEQALGLYVPTTARHVRELSLYLAHISDKALHYYLMCAEDMHAVARGKGHLLNLLGETTFPRIGVDIRHRVSRMLKKITGQPWGGDTAVIGGISLSIAPEDMDNLRDDLDAIRAACLHSMEQARTTVLPALIHEFDGLEPVPMVSLGCVNSDNSLNLAPTADSHLCFVQPDGSRQLCAPQDYQEYIVEEYADWTQCSFPRLRQGPPLQLDPQHPEGVFRVGPLARLHACERISTPLAQAELEFFRAEHGRLPQNVLLYHWARLIELVHCVEKVGELLESIDTDDIFLRDLYQPEGPAAPAHGFAHVEAPRGSLFYHVSIDAEQCVTACEILTPTACNNAALNISLTSAVRFMLGKNPPAADYLESACACFRAYDPCPACATHMLTANSTGASPLPATAGHNHMGGKHESA